MHGHAWARSVMHIFAIFNVFFFITDNQRIILSYQTRQLPCRARGARVHNLCSHLPFRIDSLYMDMLFSFHIDIYLP